MARRRQPDSPFKRFNSSPDVIRLVVMMYVRFPLSLRNIEDLLFERWIDICHETVRFWWHRFGPLFAADIRRQRISRTRGFGLRRRHLDEMLVKINGEQRFRRVKSLQRFASIHVNVHNHFFNADRHPNDGQTDKATHSAALAEWQSLMA